MPPYALTGTTADFSKGDKFNRYMKAETEASSSIVVSIAANSVGFGYAYTCAGIPNSASWETGNWTQLVNVTVSNPNIRLLLAITRLNTAGDVLQQIAANEGSVFLNTTGVKTYTWTSPAFTNMSATDRIAIRYRFQNTFGSTQNVRIETGTANTYLTTPVSEDPQVAPAAATPEATETPSLARAYLHDAGGARIAQFSTSADIQRSYLRGDAGAASLLVALDDPALPETDPLRGRLLVIESDAYPLPWVGFVSGRSGGRGGSVEVRADEYVSILSTRHTSEALAVSGAPYDAMRAVIDGLDGALVLRILPDDAARSGGRVDLSFRNDTIRDALDTIAAASDPPVEWWLDYTVSPARVDAELRVAGAHGAQSYQSAALVDGGYARWDSWTEDASALTASTIVVGGTSSPLAAYVDRPLSLVEREDLARRAPHGFFPESLPESSPDIVRRQRVVRVDALLDGERVQTASQAIAAADAARAPYRVLSVTALWSADAASWERLLPGSVVRVHAPGAFIAGYFGPARILGAMPREQSGELDLTLEIVSEVAAR